MNLILQEKEIEIFLTDEISEETEQSEDGASDLIKREMELCRREKEVAELELSLMRQQFNNLRLANNQQNTIDFNVQNNRERERVNLSELKDLENIFDDSDGNYASWEKQVKYVKTVYNLSEGKTKALLSARLKGKALEWFHSQPENLKSSLEDHLKEMKVMFNYKPRKLASRKLFEGRYWKHGEKFSEYVHDKVIMGNRVPVDKEEIIDHIIDGIPDALLKNQARMQSFESVAELLKAFEKVTIRP